MKEIELIEELYPKEKYVKDFWEKLLAAGIPFLVNISRETLRGSDASAWKHTVQAAKKDLPVLKKLLFKQLVEYNAGGNPYYTKEIVEHKMSEQDIAWFRDHQELFTKVFHSCEGRIYELTGKSFKEYFKTAEA